MPALLHLVQTSCLTFLPASTWTDRNDAYFIDMYKGAARLKSLLAICMSSASETFHHWSVFAPGPSGVCIAFKRHQLVNALQSQHRNIRSQAVEYRMINNVSGTQTPLGLMPFLKRWPYRPELEFRFVYESRRQEREFLNVPIPLSGVDRVCLSPLLPIG